MICPKCKEENLKSKVFPGFTYSTAMGWTPYYDEEGVFHSHDPNYHTDNYKCSNGHTWTNNYLIKCSACNYGDKE